ncbi:MAG: hypothetical protein ACI8PQ_003014, partial [Planctomycetota bacterium]
RWCTHDGFNRCDSARRNNTSESLDDDPPEGEEEGNREGDREGATSNTKKGQLQP